VVFIYEYFYIHANPYISRFAVFAGADFPVSFAATDLQAGIVSK